MTNEDTKKIAKSILRDKAIFYMATIDRGTPRVRPMTCLHAEDFKIWTCSHKDTGKMAEIKQHNEVECCFMDDEHRQVRILGSVKIFEEEKDWKDLPFSPESIPMLEDPDYLLLLIEPQEVRFINDWSQNYKCINL
jgi:general stress protein 26